MYNIIPLILILISLSIIIIIVIKKFTVLASLDVESMPKEKEAKFKEEIISGRLRRNIIKYGSKTTRIIKPAMSFIVNALKSTYNKLHDIKDSYKKEEVLPKEKVEEKADELLGEVDELIKNEKLEEAEKKLIEIIDIDNKNIEAFKTLGELYYERKNFNDAKQTFEHVIKLEEEESSEIYFDLALVNKDMEDIEGATKNMKKALAIDPKNPRYLDTLFDISIINKETEDAVNSYKRLKEVNPENQKLDEMKKQINEL